MSQVERKNLAQLQQIVAQETGRNLTEQEAQNFGLHLIQYGVKTLEQLNGAPGRVQFFLDDWAANPEAVRPFHWDSWCGLEVRLSWPIDEIVQGGDLFKWSEVIDARCQVYAQQMRASAAAAGVTLVDRGWNNCDAVILEGLMVSLLRSQIAQMDSYRLAEIVARIESNPLETINEQLALANPIPRPRPSWWVEVSDEEAIQQYEIDREAV